WWGTSRPPFAEGPSHSVLAAAIGLSAKSGGALCSGSAHAGMEALLGAADAVGAGSARVALVVVSDAIVPGTGTSFEGRSGGAAAALLGAIGALDASGSVALIGFGGGRATGVVITAENAVPGAAAVPHALSAGRPMTYSGALRVRNQLVATGETVPMGVPPE